MIDAVVLAGGKQYRVHEGSVLNVASLDAEAGSRVELRDVLLVNHEGNVTVGTPTVDGAVVVAEVVEHGRGKKVVSFKYKAKVRYRRKRGHRQGYTQLSIREITANGVTVTAPEPEVYTPPTPEPPMDMSQRPAGFAGRVETDEPIEEAPAEGSVPEEPEAEVVETVEAAAPEAVVEAEAPEADAEEAEEASTADETAAAEATTEEEKPAPRPRRRRRTSGGDSGDEQTQE